MKHQQISFIYWFAYYNVDSPAVRYRGKYPLDYCKKKLGIDSYFVMPGYTLKHILLFIRAYLSALINRKPDSLIVIQRVQSDFIYASLLRFLVRIRRKDTVYDIDDADYLVSNLANIYYFATHCEHVSAGSEQIRQHLKQYNSNTILITTPTADLHISKQERQNTFTIGWIGAYGPEHASGLYELLYPALCLLAFPCTLILIGVNEESDRNSIIHYFQNSPLLQIEMPQGIDWNNEEDLQKRIAGFDIGIATLSSSPYQLSKSGIKVKQYLNNGIPVLCNNLPENNRFVVDGYNGFLCSNVHEFQKRIHEFHTMSDEDYFKFSANAKKSSEHFDHGYFFRALNEIKKK